MIKAETLNIPLRTDSEGVVRVGRTRVRLATVVFAFNEGYTAEEIVSQYPALLLSDVYAVIAYYLNNRTVVDTYISEQDKIAQALREEVERRPEYQAFRQQLSERRAKLQAEKA